MKEFNSKFKSLLTLVLIYLLVFLPFSNIVNAAPSDGTEDTDFYTNLGSGFDNTIQSIVVQSNGQIIAGGGFTDFNGNTRNRLVRLNSDGTEDTDFYTNLGAGFNGIIFIARVQSNGKILVGGNFTTFNGNTRNRLVRLNSDGTEDTDFYTNLGSGFGSSYVGSISIQSNGKILVGGDFTTFNGNTRNRLVRLNSDGTEDTDFYTSLGTGFTTVSSTVNNVALQSNGKILVGGDFTTFNGNTRNRLVRLNSDGTEDTDFYTNLGGGVSTGNFSLALNAADKIFLGGGSLYMLSLNSDGTQDSVFSANLGSGVDGAVYSIAVQSDGDIVLTGEFGGLNGNAHHNLLRLNSDGTEDTNFYTNLGTSFNNDGNSVAIQSDGKILVGGAFTTFNSNTRNRLVRLNSVAVPVLSEITPVASIIVNNFNPSYTFSSTQAGTITYGGSCTSSTTNATVGNNTITWNLLTVGDYSNCTITVTSVTGASLPLSVSPFSLVVHSGGGFSPAFVNASVAPQPIPTTPNPITTQAPVNTENPIPAIKSYTSPIDDTSKSCPAFTKYLRKGNKLNDKNEVILWQAFLNKNYNSNLKIDGLYGNNTEKAIKDFQNKYKEFVLTPWDLNSPTGYTYKSTRAYANKIIGCPEGLVNLDNGNTVNY